MKILVTGANGQLGCDVLKEIERRGYDRIGSARTADSTESNYISMDITDVEAVNNAFQMVDPDAVIHCAAWTNVDAAEENENATAVRKINRDGTQNISNACKRYGAKMLYISTDYIFDGNGETPWKPDGEECKPLNFYGLTKLEGENAVITTLEDYFIVRTSWVFGVNGKNFVKTMLNIGKNREEVRVVNDQIGRPTYTKDLARLLVDMIETEKYGVYHATNDGENISWCDFTKEIFRQVGMATKVIPVTTREYGLNKANRPFNSRLDNSKLIEKGFKMLPDWKDALQRYLKESNSAIPYFAQI